MFVTPSLDFASQRALVGSCASRACRRTTSGATLAFEVLVSSHTFLKLHTFCGGSFPMFSQLCSSLLKFFGFDLHDDDTVEVQF